jgi:hypothetical protein
MVEPKAPNSKADPNKILNRNFIEADPIPGNIIKPNVEYNQVRRKNEETRLQFANIERQERRMHTATCFEV